MSLWFQGVKNVSPIGTGIHLLAITIGMIVSGIFTGLSVSKIGYFKPFMILSGVLMALGMGFCTTLSQDSGKGMWIPYLALIGLSAGFGFQGPLIAAQTVLEPGDVAVGTSIAIFAQSLGSTLWISVGTSVFANLIASNFKAMVPSVNPQAILKSGATDFRTIIQPQYLKQALEAYDKSVVHTLYVGLALGCVMTFAALAIQWRSVKKPPQGSEQGSGQAE
jgi:hypothetical protein